MRDVLCVYYSRSGNTKKVMKSIAAELNAELVQLTDGVERGGLRGWFRCGLDAVKRDCPAARPIETERRLENYRKQHGKELNRVAYVLTRGSEHKSEDIYRQMDLYTAKPHRAATSLRVGHVGHTFWQEEFLRQIREILDIGE